MKKKQKRSGKSKKKNLGKFKSAIEKYCSDSLKSAKIPFDYEEKEFVLMDKFRFENKYFKMTAKKKDMSDRYTPDFVSKDGSLIIETNGYLPSHHDFPMRWKLFLRYIMDNELNYDVYLAKNRQQVDQAISEIKKSMGNG